MKDRETLSEILHGVSHPLRMTMIEALEEEPGSFSGIMVMCGLNPNSDSGLFNYHLSELIDHEIVEKDADLYHLTSFGRSVLNLLRTLESERFSFKAKTDLKKMPKKVEIIPVEDPMITIKKEDCKLELGQIYWGVTLKTRGLDKVTAVWPLSDGSVIYETRDPPYESEGHRLLHLKENGLYVIENVFEAKKGKERAILRFGYGEKKEPVLPLPLEVGRQIKYESLDLQLSTNTRVTGWKSIEGGRKVEGEVTGQYQVNIDGTDFNCLLLREIIQTSAVSTKEDGSREKRDPSIRVMMDRYLDGNGRLKLEHLWYCEEGGRKSMSREEARKSAGPVFKEMEYAGTSWFRVHQVELDEPRPEEAKMYIQTSGKK